LQSKVTKLAKYAFIGAGIMGGAILRSSAVALSDAEFFVFDVIKSKAQEFADLFGNISAVDSITDAVNSAEYIFICLKPQYASEPLKEISAVIGGKTLVSIMAGVTVAKLRAALGDVPKIVRVMPNMPAMIGKGMTSIADDSPCPPEAEAVLKASGEICCLPESQLDAATAAAACSPAFAFMFIEAMADAGVAAGLSRDNAVKLVAGALDGAAAMIINGGEPAKLKDAVCSPAGSTIAGVAELENSGFRGSVMRAFTASWERNKELGEVS
jgi:pyrroline-5-carboxylate reductase